MEKSFLQLNQSNTHPVVLEMKDFASSNQVPIISDEGLVYLKQIVRLKKAKRILEIGTAIGYCSINLALLGEDIVIDSIERDEKWFFEGLKNVEKANLTSRVRLFLADALELDLGILKEEYDLIFIDAAKAQYTHFFEKYGILLPVGGIVVTDNLLFHGLVESKEAIQSKNLRNLVAKIRLFNLWLANNPAYHTTFLKIGDGMAVSEKL